MDRSVAQGPPAVAACAGEGCVFSRGVFVGGSVACFSGAKCVQMIECSQLLCSCGVVHRRARQCCARVPDVLVYWRADTAA